MGLRLLPKRLGPGAPGGERVPRRFEPSLGLGRGGDSVPANEFEQAEHQRKVGRQLVRIAQQQALARDREFLVGKPGAVLAEILQERAFALFGVVDGAPRLVENRAGALEILARAEGEFLLGQARLRLEIERVVIHSGPVMKEAAHGGEEGRGTAQFAALPVVFHFQRRQAIHGAHILQAAGVLFHIGLRMARSVPVRGVAHAHILTQALAHLLAMEHQCGRQFGCEFLECRAVASQKTAAQQAEREHAGSLHGFQAFGHGVHRGVGTQPGIPKQPDELGQPLLERFASLGRVGKQHDVEFGVRERVAASVRPAGQHGNPLREGRFHRHPVGFDHRLIAGQGQRLLDRGAIARGKEFILNGAPLPGGVLRHVSSITQALGTAANGSFYGTN